MNTYTAHQIGKIRQHEFIDHADHARAAKEARVASRSTDAPARQPLIWLRDAAAGFATRLTALTGAHAANH